MTATGEGTVSVELVGSAAPALTDAVYAWIMPTGAVVRIGSSKTRVGGRLRSYATDINKRLVRETGPTPQAEADGWLACLAEAGHIAAFVHQPPMIQTVAGMLRPYLDLERALLEEHRPRFNRRGVKRLVSELDPLADA